MNHDLPCLQMSVLLKYHISNVGLSMIQRKRIPQAELYEVYAWHYFLVERVLSRGKKSIDLKRMESI